MTQDKKIADMTVPELMKAMHNYKYKKCPRCNSPIPSDWEECWNCRKDRNDRA